MKSAKVKQSEKLIKEVASGFTESVLAPAFE